MALLCQDSGAVLWIRDILLRIRILLFSSSTFKMTTKNTFFSLVFLLITYGSYGSGSTTLVMSYIYVYILKYYEIKSVRYFLYVR